MAAPNIDFTVAQNLISTILTFSAENWLQKCARKISMIHDSHIKANYFSPKQTVTDLNILKSPNENNGTILEPHHEMDTRCIVL